MNPKTQNILTELCQYLKSLYHKRLVQMVLFGSQVRDEAVSGSDIDVMVVLQGTVSPGKEITRISKKTSELSLEYGVVISCTFVSADRYATEQSPLLMNVRREGMPV